MLIKDKSMIYVWSIFDLIFVWFISYIKLKTRFTIGLGGDNGIDTLALILMWHEGGKNINSTERNMKTNTKHKW